MTVKKEPEYKKYIGYLKDLVLIISVVVAVYGWIASNSKNQAILETTVKYNTEAMKKVEKFMENQTLLNGKIIQYMQDN